RDGGSGHDTIDWSADPGRQVTLLGPGTLDGFRGTEATIAGGFDNIDTLFGGGTTADSLTGLDAPAAWALYPAVWSPNNRAGTYLEGNALTFAGFEQLVGRGGPGTLDIRSTNDVSLFGGGGNDLFRFDDDGSSISGTIDGGAGSDTIDWSREFSQAARLTAPGAVDGFDGTVNPVGGGFRNIDNLVGGGMLSSLTGLDAPATWALGVTDPANPGGPTINTYTSTNTLTFSGFRQLNGGAAQDTFDINGAQGDSLSGGGGDDTFRFADQSSIGGTIDGGGGTNTLDYSAYTTGVMVNLAAGTATGMSG